MTLDCKARRLYSPLVAPNLSQTPDTYSSGYRNHAQPVHDRNNSPQPLMSFVKQPAVKKSSGESFLQRLLDIERRHDEKKTMRQRVGVKTEFRANESIPVEKHNLSFSRSPTRWMSEQILDDTHEAKKYRYEEVEPLETRSPLYKSAYGRLHSLSDVQRMSPCGTDLSSSIFLPPQHDGHTNSLSTISYVEFSPTEEFPSHQQPIKRPLRLPPILLPPIYTVRPRPLKGRDFLTPTQIRGPITDKEWEDLRQCRYIRPAPPRFALPLSPS